MERHLRSELPYDMAANAGGLLDLGVVGTARPQTAERITVAMIRKAGLDLQNLQDRTGLSKTDITNRAITLYEFIDTQLRAGRDVLIRDNGTGATEIVRLL